VAENMQFKLAAGKAAEEAKEPEDADKGALKVKKIVCRLCKGDHVRSRPASCACSLPSPAPSDWLGL
jgi:hypothetical protein